jgi:hypothetical protein
MTLKVQKGIFTDEKTVTNRLLDFWGVLDNFEINCTVLSVDIGYRNLYCAYIEQVSTPSYANAAIMYLPLSFQRVWYTKRFLTYDTGFSRFLMNKLDPMCDKGFQKLKNM